MLREESHKRKSQGWERAGEPWGVEDGYEAIQPCDEDFQPGRVSP